MQNFTTFPSTLETNLLRVISGAYIGAFCLHKMESDDKVT